MHGGKDYDATWKKRQRGEGPYALMLGKRFSIAVERLGLDKERKSLDTTLFTPPRKDTNQLNLF